MRMSPLQEATEELMTPCFLLIQKMAKVQWILKLLRDKAIDISDQVLNLMR